MLFFERVQDCLPLHSHAISQRLRQHAQDLSVMSAAMQGASSEADAMLSGAESALHAARAALDKAAHKSSLRHQTVDNPKVNAKRAAYETEAGSPHPCPSPSHHPATSSIPDRPLTMLIPLQDVSRALHPAPRPVLVPRSRLAMQLSLCSCAMSCTRRRRRSPRQQAFALGAQCATGVS